MTALDYQIDFNGTVWGNGTLVGITDFTGFEAFTTRGTDVTFPAAYGAIPGSSFVDPRVVAVTLQSSDANAILALEAALLPPSNSAPDVLVPVRWKFPNREELLCYGRCGRRSRVRDLTSVAAATYRFALEFEFPDPRLYSAVLQQASLTVFTAGTSGVKLSLGSGADLGLKLSLGSGADLGLKMTGASSSGLQTLTNLGTVDTYPIFVFSPATGISSFSVTNQTTGQVLSIVQTVNPGQTLVANMMAAATGTSTGAAALPVSVNGTSVYGSWQSPRLPFRLQPGPNVLRFDIATGDTSATALVTAPSAYL